MPNLGTGWSVLELNCGGGAFDGNAANRSAAEILAFGAIVETFGRLVLAVLIKDMLLVAVFTDV